MQVDSDFVVPLESLLNPTRRGFELILCESKLLGKDLGFGCHGGKGNSQVVLGAFLGPHIKVADEFLLNFRSSH